MQPARETRSTSRSRNASSAPIRRADSSSSIAAPMPIRRGGPELLSSRLVRYELCVCHVEAGAAHFEF
jgi:hypothetical protein